MNIIFRPEDKYKNYKAAIGKVPAGMPSIPHLAISLSELTASDEQKSKFEGTKLCNFDKWRVKLHYELFLLVTFELIFL